MRKHLTYSNSLFLLKQIPSQKIGNARKILIRRHVNPHTPKSSTKLSTAFVGKQKYSFPMAG
jgi:hypothetical protein